MWGDDSLAEFDLGQRDWTCGIAYTCVYLEIQPRSVACNCVCVCGGEHVVKDGEEWGTCGNKWGRMSPCWTTWKSTCKRHNTMHVSHFLFPNRMVYTSVEIFVSLSLRTGTWNQIHKA